mgnify:CR=1 FL=1
MCICAHPRSRAPNGLSPSGQDPPEHPPPPNCTSSGMCQVAKQWGSPTDPYSSSSELSSVRLSSGSTLRQFLRLPFRFRLVWFLEGLYLLHHYPRSIEVQKVVPGIIVGTHFANFRVHLTIVGYRDCYRRPTTSHRLVPSLALVSESDQTTPCFSLVPPPTLALVIPRPPIASRVAESVRPTTPPHSSDPSNLFSCMTLLSIPHA